MNPRTLRYFAALAETGSFSRAAIRLGIAQPSLSRQIQLLERELKAELVYRHGRGISLTDAGERLNAAVGPLLQRFDEVQLEIAAQSTSPSGRLRFGIPPSIGSTIVAPLALSFRRRYPAVHLQVVEAFSGTLFEWIEAGAIDLGILYDTRCSPNMNVITLLKEELHLITAPTRCTANGAKPVAIQDVDPATLVLPGSGHGLRRAVDTAFLAAGIKLALTLEIDSVPALKQLVGLGEAQTILPFGAVHREVVEGRLAARPFASADLSATLVLATALHRPVSTATKVLIEIIHEEIARHVDNGALRGVARATQRSRQRAFS